MDGRVSELFPASLRVLFSYDGGQRCLITVRTKHINNPPAAQLSQLLAEYNLHLLEKHSENLNRFLIFIGTSPPSQL